MVPLERTPYPHWLLNGAGPPGLKIGSFDILPRFRGAGVIVSRPGGAGDLGGVNTWMVGHSVISTTLSHRLSECILSEWAPSTYGWGSLNMAKRKRIRAPAIREKHCRACGGSGVTNVNQPAAPGRRVYSPRCEECGGKGRIAIDAASADGRRLGIDQWSRLIPGSFGSVRKPDT